MRIAHRTALVALATAVLAVPAAAAPQVIRGCEIVPSPTR